MSTSNQHKLDNDKRRSQDLKLERESRTPARNNIKKNGSWLQVPAKSVGPILARGLSEVQHLRLPVRGGGFDPVHETEPNSLQEGLPEAVRPHRPLLRLQQTDPGL